MDVKALPRLDRLSPAQWFLLGSLVILVLGMAVVGAWVTQQIEDGVVQRTAATTALYVDSLIAPPLQDLADSDHLSPESVNRLDWLLEDTPLGQQVAVFQVWDREKRIVYSTVPALIGHETTMDEELTQTLGGDVSASIGDTEGEERLPAELRGQDLIEIYSPVRGRGTDEVIAAAEFYYATDDLNLDLAAAQRRSWLVVGGATIVIYLLLATFVQRVSNTVRAQQRTLAGQVARLTELLQQNQELHGRVRAAAARTAALNEQFLRRFSAELHDGPAQEISLALLRLDNVAARCADDGFDAVARAEIERELEVIHGSLRRSLQELRETSSGLLLPHLGKLSVSQTVEHVVRGHQRRTGTAPAMNVRGLPARTSLATKIALYRIVQEALNNAWRHAKGADLTVTVAGDEAGLQVEVIDNGPGFDPANLESAEDRLGLFGMRERVESLGGEFRIESAPGHGTRVTAILPHATTEGDDD